MLQTLFIRLLGHENKGTALLDAIAALREGRPSSDVFTVNPQSFLQVPGTPFCYWVSDRIRGLFSKYPPFEGHGRTVRVGLQTSDDFRFVRAWWEVPPDRVLDASRGPSWREEFHAFQQWCRNRTFEGKRWVPFAKGGEYSPYFADIHLVVNWERDGAEVRNFVDPKTGRTYSRPQNTDYYFRPGLTWPERTTSGYCPQAMPSGVVFSVTGQAMLADDVSVLLPLLSAHSTRVYEYLEELMIGLGEESVSGSAARHYTGGSVSRLPWPDDLLRSKRLELESLARRLTQSRRQEYCLAETSWVFTPFPLTAPSLVPQAKALQAQRLEDWIHRLDDCASVERTIRDNFALHTEEVSEIISIVGPHPTVDLPDRAPSEILAAVAEALTEPIDSLIDHAVDSGLISRSITKKSFFVTRFHELLAQQFRCSARTVLDAHRSLGEFPVGEFEEFVRGVLSYCLGVVFGRWDIRLALDPLLVPPTPDPLDPLPVCPPAMLVGPDGLPAKSDHIVSEDWLRARPHASALPPLGTVPNPTVPDSEYPIAIAWDGILVDDPGFEGAPPHRADIVRRVREVIDLLWGDHAQDIEQEACEALGVRNLRDYFRKPSGFFRDHLKRYSRSRRKAPIYWPLSTRSGSYTIWIYYHRLTDQTLYAAVNKYLEPKIADTEKALGRLETQLATEPPRTAARLRDRLHDGRAFLAELQELREELLRVARLPYRPDLNDGVIINAAPLHSLFRHRTWAKDTANTWKRLQNGAYDWAHMAYTIWPDRVRDACRRDRSIAIAHDLENIYELQPPARRTRSARRRRRERGDR